VLISEFLVEIILKQVLWFDRKVLEFTIKIGNSATPGPKLSLNMSTN